MKLQELYEQVQWAIGPNQEHATIRGKHDLNNPEFTLIWVDIANLFNQLDPDQYIDLKTASGQIKGRIGRAKGHWEAGGYMDPAVVGYNQYRDHFVFTDGRHRLVTAYQLGEQFAPILVPKEQVDIFKERMHTK